MQRLVEDLPLAPEVLEALLRKEGQLGKILEVSLGYERGEWNKISGQLVDSEETSTLYWESVKWANEVMEAVF